MAGWKRTGKRQPGPCFALTALVISVFLFFAGCGPSVSPSGEPVGFGVAGPDGGGATATGETRGLSAFPAGEPEWLTGAGEPEWLSGAGESVGGTGRSPETETDAGQAESGTNQAEERKADRAMEQETGRSTERTEEGTAGASSADDGRSAAGRTTGDGQPVHAPGGLGDAQDHGGDSPRPAAGETAEANRKQVRDQVGQTSKAEGGMPVGPVRLPGKPPEESETDSAKGTGTSGAGTAEQGETAERDGDNTLTFGELYASVGVRGVQFSDKLVALSGKEVEMSGFMAPPLTAGVRFFVLTKVLMAVCPFCSTDEDWPADIVVVYLPEGEELNPTEHPVKVTGTLETGSHTDEETGFVSLVRIYAEKVEVLK